MSGRLPKLPKWVVSNAESVRQEVEQARHMTMDERCEVLHRVCVTAARMAQADPERWEVLRKWQDPLPESTVNALARLRTEYRRKRDGS